MPGYSPRRYLSGRQEYNGVRPHTSLGYRPLAPQAVPVTGGGVRRNPGTTQKLAQTMGAGQTY
jgi:hypothetical protein